MGIIDVTQPSDGTTADAGDVNNQVNTIVNEFNGNIDSDNLASAAVSTAKIADANVTPAKMDSTYQIDICSGDVALNNASNFFDITGISIDITTASTSAIAFYVQLEATVGGGGSVNEIRVKNSTDTTYSTSIIYKHPTDSTAESGALTITGYLFFSGVTAGAKTFILQAKSNDTAMVVKATNTWLAVPPNAIASEA